MKKRWTLLLVLLSMIILILDVKTARNGAEKGIELCVRSVIPALFPFIYLTNLLSKSWDNSEIKMLRPIARCFRLPDHSGNLLIGMFLGGYPVGAQSIANEWSAGRLSTDAAQKLLSICSNVGPSFLFGILSQKFHQIRTVWLIWGIQILSVWLVSQIIMIEKPIIIKRDTCNRSAENVMELSIRTMGKICGSIILFRIVIAFLDRYMYSVFSTDYRPAIIGLLELSNGCCELNQISDEEIRFIVACGMLSFGGLCVLLQTISVCNGLNLKNYILGKTLQSVFSTVIAFSVIRHVWIIPVSVFLGVQLLSVVLKKHLAFRSSVVYNK